MKTLLTPPAITKKVEGHLWWKKLYIRMNSVVLDADQGRSCGLSLYEELDNIFKESRRIWSLEVRVVGDAQATFFAYESLFDQFDANPALQEWLTEEVSLYELTFVTKDDELIRGFTYYTEDGERKRAEMKPMNQDDLREARERAVEDLKEIIQS